MAFYKYKNYSDMKSERPEQLQTSRKLIQELINRNHDNVILSAPVKSGKKEIEIFLREELQQQYGSLYEVIHITALNDKAAKQHQFPQLNQVGIDAFVSSDKIALGKFINHISTSKTYIICVDECDYGSRKDDSIEKSINQIRDQFILAHGKNLRAKFVWISATPENFTLSNDLNVKNYPLVTFVPSNKYRGPEWFKNNHLTHKATEFFDDVNNVLNLTKQAESIIIDFYKQEKPLMVVRLTYNNLYKRVKENQNIVENLIKNLGVIPPHFQFVDAEQSLQNGWCENELLTDALRYRVTSGKKMIIFINQVFSRSAETDMHEFLFGVHDFRKPNKFSDPRTARATIIQAFRWAHYDDQGHKIKIWWSEPGPTTKPIGRSKPLKRGRPSKPGHWVIINNNDLKTKYGKSDKWKNTISKNKADRCRDIINGARVGKPVLLIDKPQGITRKKEIVNHTKSWNDMMKLRSDIKTAYDIAIKKGELGVYVHRVMKPVANPTPVFITSQSDIASTGV